MIVSATRLANRPARFWDRRPLRRGVPTHRRGPPCRRSDRTTVRSKTESRRAESSTQAEACAPSSIRLENPSTTTQRKCQFVLSGSGHSCRPADHANGNMGMSAWPISCPTIDVSVHPFCTDYRTLDAVSLSNRSGLKLRHPPYFLSLARIPFIYSRHPGALNQRFGRSGKKKT